MNNIGLKLGFIGVGQCGGNFANEFSKLGYKAIALNTSGTDLDKLDNIPTNNRLLINVGIQGAGKNPEVGKQALEEHISEVMFLIEQVFDKTDVIYVGAGLGGGTGSGIAPLLTQVLSEQGYKVGMVVTIPAQLESPKAKIVALNAFEELSHIENLCGVFVVDNSKATKLPSQMGIKTKYSVVNENIALKIDTINKITNIASDLAFDARDFLTLLESRGSVVIASHTIDEITQLKEEEFLAQTMRKALNNSVYANSNFRQAKGCAFLFELPEGGANYVTEEAIGKMQKELGNPFEIFTGVYENKGKKKEGVLHVIVSGLPFPMERLIEIQSQLEEQAENIQNLFEVSQKQKFEGNGKSLLNKFITPYTNAEKPVIATGESTLDKLLKRKK